MCHNALVEVLHSFVNGFSGKADQISWSASLNSGTNLVFGAACGKTPALPPNLITQWIEVG